LIWWSSNLLLFSELPYRGLSVRVDDNHPKELKQTVETKELVWQGTYHRGIDDAINVEPIVKEMPE
jgi:inhibitor of KinA sporulation pathway (predicted exonuclease)